MLLVEDCHYHARVGGPKEWPLAGLAVWNRSLVPEGPGASAACPHWGQYVNRGSVSLLCLVKSITWSRSASMIRRVFEFCGAGRLRWFGESSSHRCVKIPVCGPDLAGNASTGAYVPQNVPTSAYIRGRRPRRYIRPWKMSPWGHISHRTSPPVLISRGTSPRAHTSRKSHSPGESERKYRPT